MASSGQGYDDYYVTNTTDEDDDDFGQILPPFHIYVKRVLDKYPEGGQILKELLQNADDSGAKKVIFLYDKTHHPTKHLWSDSLSDFNGPALYVYNDATFKKQDWYNIQHPEQSGKHDDPLKVGRFGLGFMSVYHLTACFTVIREADTPSELNQFIQESVASFGAQEATFSRFSDTKIENTFLNELTEFKGFYFCGQCRLSIDMPSVFSDKQVGFLDPHECYFTKDPITGVIEKGKRGKKWRISSKLLEPHLRDQFSPFIRPLFECNEDTFKRGEYHGTIFRFPLRMNETYSKSKVSSVVYDDTRVKKLFDSFQYDAEISLLFLKNIESISVFDTNQSSHSAELLYRVEISQESQVTVRLKRSEFMKECQKKDTDAISRFNLKIRSHLTRHLQPSVCTVNNYLIVNMLKRQDLNKQMHKLMVDKDVNQLPWVGLAVNTGPPIATSGRIFCFLPLPESESSHLPVHIHGYFGLGDNRRSIKWPDRESKHDKAAIWNKLLVEEIFPEAYVKLIDEAIHLKNTPSFVYKLWPNVQTLSGVWKTGIECLIAKLKEKKVLYTKLNGGSWEMPGNVYIDTDQTDMVQRIMLQKGYPIVELPPHILEALSWGKAQYKKVTPCLMRAVVRDDKLDWLNRKEKLKLLHYILGDRDFSDLENVHLLPLQDGSFAQFSRRGKAIYIPSLNVPGYLFPNMESMLSSEDCPNVLKSDEARSNTQLTSLSVETVPSVLNACLPHHWINGKTVVTWTPGSDQQPGQNWLEKMWVWIQQVNISLHSFANLPLIQISTHGNAIRLARMQPNTLIFQHHTNWNMTTELSNCVCMFLESLGAVVVRYDLPSYIAQHNGIQNYVNAGNGEGVMYVLEALWTDTIPNKIAQSNAELKRDMVLLVINMSILPQQWKTLLRLFPIFKASDGEFVSVQQCSSGIPTGLYGIPVHKLRQRFILLDSNLNLAKALGVQEVQLETLLVKYVFPDVENQLYSQQKCEKVMKWVLENPSLDNIVKQVNFLPTSNGTFLKPSELFDPSNTLLTTLFQDQPVFPINIYASGRLLHHLKRIGLRDESTISAQEILGIACLVSNCERGKSLQKYICKHLSMLSTIVMYKRVKNSLGVFLKKLPWVACELRPSSYPAVLPWYGNSSMLYRPDEVKLVRKANLLGSVAPLVKVKACNTALSTIFGWNGDIPLEQVIAHMRNILKSKNLRAHMQSVYGIILSIYEFLANIPKENLKPIFTADGIMANEAWAWHGSGFTTSDKIAFSSVMHMGNMVPHLYVVPTELHRFRGFMITLGVRDSFIIGDYVNVLETIHESQKNNPLNKQYMVIVQDIIKALMTFTDLQNMVCRILVPDQKCVLRSTEDLTYNDTTGTNQSMDIIYTHHSITRLQAAKLGIRTQRDVQLDQCSTDHGFELPFGQIEKLTTRLSGILQEYSHQPDVLKELLQNADDAEASEIHVVYDPRRHSGTNISGSSWKPIHTSPAICVYNDKPFKNSDIEGIQNVGVGGKMSDASTTGRFGIGFNAVYHLTDCPTFLTQNMSKLCVFDPHVKYVPRATPSKPGKLYSQQGDEGYLVNFPDMIQGYLQEYRQFNLETGTMFRFPLRLPGMISEISDRFYDSEKVNTLLREFEIVSSEALLFLKNIQKISISEIDQNTSRLRLRYCVSVDVSPEDKEQRQELSTHIKRYKDNAINEIPQLNRVYTLTMKDSKGKHENWLVSQSIGLDPDKVSNEHCGMTQFRAKSFLPIGGAATLLNGNIKSGKAFCFLPLQIETNLSIHVNGTFVLDQSRRNLKKGDHDIIHPWNRLLADHVIGSAYASVIQIAGRLLFKSSNLSQINGQWSCSKYDKLFPSRMHQFHNVWKLVAVATLQYIGACHMQVLPVLKKDKDSDSYTVTWCNPKPMINNAYFDDLDKLDYELSSAISRVSPKKTNEEKKSHILRMFLLRTGFHLISSSGDICHAFIEAGIKAEFVSPEHCLTHIRVIECIAPSLPCHVSLSEFKSACNMQTVLEYCHNGIHEVADLLGLPFQLQNNGIVDVFSANNPKYITYDYRLLPQLQQLFIHSVLIKTLLCWIEEKDDRLSTAYSSQLLKEFSIYRLAEHMDTQLPATWRGSTCHVKWLNNHPTVHWLKELWRFICRCCAGDNLAKLEALADWPILPTTSGCLVAIKMAKSVIFLEDFNDTFERQQVSKALKKLGCPVVSIEQITSSSSGSKQLPKIPLTLLTILKAYLATPTSHVDILRVVQYVVTKENAVFTGRLTPRECDTLLRYFQGFCDSLSDQDITQIKQMPLFPMATSNRRVCIHNILHCHTYNGVESLPNIDSWIENAECVFLTYNVSFAQLYQTLRIHPIGMTETLYLYVLPQLHLLCQTSRLACIKYIRNYILPSASPEEERQLYHTLKGIQFIPGVDGEPREASYFYDSKNDVFSAMINSHRFLPHDFQTNKWYGLLIKIGLHNVVTSEMFIGFACEIEQSARTVTGHVQYAELKRKSKILSRELRCNDNLYDKETLTRIAPIKFLPLLKVDTVRQMIYPQYSSVNTNESNFICFQGGVSEEYKDLNWSVDTLIPTFAVPKEKHAIIDERRSAQTINVHESLGMRSKPVMEKVLLHINNICNRMAEQNAYDKEDSMKKDMRLELNRIVTKMLECLNDNLEGNDEEIKEGLQHTPICLVDEGVVLVRANQLVFEVAKNTEYLLRPYLYKAPRELAKYDRTLRVLGAQDETTFDQLAMVLKGIKSTCMDQKMHTNEMNQAHTAACCLFRLLDSTEGKCPITVGELFLPTSVGKLRRSTNLCYTDLGVLESSELPSSGVEYLVPLKQLLGHRELVDSQEESRLIGLLPDNLRPQKMATHERPLETNRPCNDGTGSRCPLVGQMTSLINSDDLQTVLLRLIHHQMKQAPNLKQQKNVSNLKEFDSYLCVQQLKTGFFDENGKLVCERKISRDVFLARHDGQEIQFELIFAHSDIFDYTEKNSLIFLPLAKSINQICHLNLDPTHIQYLREVIPLSSMVLRNKCLAEFGIPEYENAFENLSPAPERPGSIVPRDIWCLLDDDMMNKFNPGDIAVYKRPVDDGHLSFVDAADCDVFYVYARVIERLPLENTDDESPSLRRKYKIDIGDCIRIVSVVDLFMFRRSQYVHEPSGDTAVMLYTGDTVADEHQHFPSDFNEVKINLRRDVEEAMLLPANERKECFRRLYRKWHPDKNPHQVQLATKAFQFLKQEIEKQSSVSSSLFSRWDSDIRRDNTEEQQYRNASSRQYFSSSSNQDTDSPFYPRSFSHKRSDPRNARLWLRQALEDFATAEEHHQKRIVISLAWPALMIQQASEKALKAAIFYLEGNNNFSHNLHQLVCVVCEHASVEEYKQGLRDSVNKLVQLGCEAVRTRYPEDGTNRTTGEVYQKFDTKEALDICKFVLEMVRLIIDIKVQS